MPTPSSFSVMVIAAAVVAVGGGALLLIIAMRMMMALPLLDALKHLPWIMYVLHRLPHLFCRQNVYRASTGYTQCNAIIDALNTLPNALRIGEEVLAKKCLPKFIISPKYLAYSQMDIVGAHGDACPRITVWRFHWTEPLIPLPVERALPVGCTTIKVVQRVSNRDEDARELELVTEIAVPRELIGSPVYEASLTAARIMAECFEDPVHDRASRIFILHGAPGVGKTTATRILARQLGASLYPDYNPTRPSDNMRYMLSNYTGDGDADPLVVVYEEFDVTLDAIARGTVPDRDGYCLDASDKSSWNKLLDCFKRRVNALLVMTTNKSYEEIADMIDESKSMLRKGRVDAHFVWSPSGKIERLEPHSSASLSTPADDAPGTPTATSYASPQHVASADDA